MHILLTDVLSCPRCGPRFGLIVLADRLEDRRVAGGSLGCANCREEYPVEAGIPDLRYPLGSAPVLGPAREAGPEAAYRMAALLGVGDRPGTVLLLGCGPQMAAEVARLLPQASVVAGTPADAGEPPASGAVTWLRLGASLPFRDGSLRAIGTGGPPSPGAGEELVRVLVAGGNLVMDPAPAGAARELASRGLRILLEQEGVVVASPPPRR